MEYGLRFRRVIARGLTIAVLWAGAATAATPPAVGETLRRFLSTDTVPLTSYVAIRRLEAHNPRYRKHGWLSVRTRLDPSQGFSYDILSEGGSGYIRDRVLRKVLEREARAFASGESTAAFVAPENYEFGPEQMGEDGFVHVALTPRRRDELLLVGALHLEPGTGDLIRIEGRAAKPPSFWTRRVDVVRRYARVGGIRVPVEMQSTASVLVAGPSSFAMRYEYESINGQAVNVETLENP